MFLIFGVSVLERGGNLRDGTMPRTVTKKNSASSHHFNLLLSQWRCVRSRAEFRLAALALLIPVLNTNTCPDLHLRLWSLGSASWETALRRRIFYFLGVEVSVTSTLYGELGQTRSSSHTSAPPPPKPFLSNRLPFLSSFYGNSFMLSAMDVDSDAGGGTGSARRRRERRLRQFLGTNG